MRRWFLGWQFVAALSVLALASAAIWLLQAIGIGGRMYWVGFVIYAILGVCWAVLAVQRFERRERQRVEH